MKAFIIINHQSYVDIVPKYVNQHGLMFPVCNKPLIAHWVDFAIQCGSRDIYILSDTPIDNNVQEWFGDGTRWGVRMTFRSTSPQTVTMDQMIKKIHVDANSRYMIMKGYFFVQYDKKQDYVSQMNRLPSGDLMSCKTGQISIFGPSETGSENSQEKATFQLIPIETMEDLFQLSIRTISDIETRFFLPGYAQANGVIIGKDSAIDPSATIVPPVMIGDHVKIHDNVTVGPNVVVGNHVVIDSHTELKDTVVFDKTYVGSHLTLSHKFTNGSILIDPRDNTVIQLEEPQLLSSMENAGDKERHFGATLKKWVPRIFSRRKGSIPDKTP